MPTDPPTPQIAAAFGLPAAPLIPVNGGQGDTFRLENTALKRCHDVAQTEWLSTVLQEIEPRGFRIARPRRARTGNFVVDGWCAAQWLDGTTHMEGHWHEAIAALQSLHETIGHIARSPALHRKENPFIRADTIVWSDTFPTLRIHPIVDDMAAMLRPVSLRSQLIQGDPSEGNFLFSPNLPPAIIDFSPNWRPADYSIALLIADGIAWSHAPETLLNDVADRPEIKQLLLRAILFRIIVNHFFHPSQASSQEQVSAYAPIIRAIEKW